jgi:PiT family inorganic phosphate transporter
MAARASRRAAMMAMAALAVIITSQQGLPISTTQVTIGAVLGIGFLRESLKANCERIIAEIEQHHSENGSEQHEIEAFLKEREASSRTDDCSSLGEIRQRGECGESSFSKAERKGSRRVHCEALERAVMMRLIAAWMITVQATALISTTMFYTTVKG